MAFVVPYFFPPIALLEHTSSKNKNDTVVRAEKLPLSSKSATKPSYTARPVSSVPNEPRHSRSFEEVTAGS